MTKQNTHDESIEEIKTLYKKYSAEDVFSALFASSLWLPNSTSYIQHQLFVATALALKQSAYQEKNKINEYNKLKEFLEKLYALTSGYPTFEDYIPTLDWGEVKFPYEDEQYKILYGGELDNAYDYMTLFKILYCNMDGHYQEQVKRSPTKEFEGFLILQDSLLNKITSQKKLTEEVPDIELMHTEVPTEKFWKECISFIKTSVITELFPEESLGELTINMGNLNEKSLTAKNFLNKVGDGNLLKHLFVQVGTKYIPILPRRGLAVLLDRWSNYCKKLVSEGETSIERNYQKEITIELAKYLQGRLNKRELFPLISAQKDNSESLDEVFAAGISTEETFIAVYALPPVTDREKCKEFIRKYEAAIKESINNLKRTPVKFAWHLEKTGMQAPYNHEKVETLIVIPQATTKMFGVESFKNLNPRIMFLEEFLAILDEIESAEDLVKYWDYCDDLEKNSQFVPITSNLDKFASYIDSHGVLVPGANTPNMIFMDLSWGTNYRYKSLASFWELYPQESWYGNPREWNVKKERENSVRVTSKTENMHSAIYLTLGDKRIFISAPFEKLGYKEGSLANLFVECVGDYFARFSDLLEQHSFFQGSATVHTLIFPNNLTTSEDFKHIVHLKPEQDELWKLDTGWFQPGRFGIRIVFNIEKVLEMFEDISSNDIEIELIKDIVNAINDRTTREDIKKITDAIEKLRGNPARFRAFHADKNAAFPDFVNTMTPGIHEHKLARKNISFIAKEAGLEQGLYEKDEAKKLIVDLRAKILELIEKEVQKFDWEDSIRFLITRTDALVHKYEMARAHAKNSLEQEVEYNPEERHAEAHNEFVLNHKCYRYLIEKFLQLKPKGPKKIDSKEFKYMASLVDKLIEVYAASDHLFYGIYPAKLRVSYDYVTSVEYPQDIDAMQKRYGEEESQIQLGIIGNNQDKVESPTPFEDYLDDLDKAFAKDLGFSIAELLSILQILSQWAYFQEKVVEKAYYQTKKETIQKTCMKHIPNLTIESFNKIIDFLTLEQNDLLKVIGENELAADLPVWEHDLRPFRYTIRPLIEIEDDIVWGPYSAYKTRIIWENVAIYNKLPANMDTYETKKVIDREKKLIETALEIKTLEIIKRHTKFADSINYSRGTHPQELGDYDTLAYIKGKNVLLNIECKDLLPVYNLKKASELKEKIFDDTKPKKYLKRVENREEYLKNNINAFNEKLEWDIKKDAKIISLFITRHNYWWTKFPPIRTNVKFMRIDLLEEYLESI